MTRKLGYSLSELMAFAAAKELKDDEIVFVGAGVPSIACAFAQRTHAPGLTIVIELGIVGPKPDRTPVSILDPALIKNATLLCDMIDTLGVLLPYVDVGFLGAAQVDKYGNLNSTAIGDYFNPKVRLTGSGGASDITSIAKRYIVMMKHAKERIVEKVDYLTSVGYFDGSANAREKLGLIGGGPSAVFTDLGILRFDRKTKEIYVDTHHPGVTIEEIKGNTGFDIRISSKIKETPVPTEQDLKILRSLDPENLYLK